MTLEIAIQMLSRVIISTYIFSLCVQFPTKLFAYLWELTPAFTLLVYLFTYDPTFYRRKIHVLVKHEM
jgi:hypothetical protein